MHRRTRRLVGGAAALGAGAILVAPLPALARSDGDGPSTSAPVPDNPADPASDRGGSGQATRVAEALQPLVDAGTITEAQRDAVSEALRDAGAAWERGHGPGRPDAGWGGSRRVGPVSLTTAAATIGIPADDLRDALRDGQTLAEVAAANDVEPQAVIDALVAEAAERLDDAVADGRLDQDDADERRQGLTERITEAVNEGIDRFGPEGVAPRRQHDGEEGDRPERPGRPVPGVPSRTDEADAPATTEAGG